MASRNVKNKKQNNHKMFSLFFFFLKKHSFYAASRNTVIFFILLILFSKTLHGDFPDWLPGNSFCFYFPKKLLFSLKKNTIILFVAWGYPLILFILFLGTVFWPSKVRRSALMTLAAGIILYA